MSLTTGSYCQTPAVVSVTAPGPYVEVGQANRWRAQAGLQGSTLQEQRRRLLSIIKIKDPGWLMCTLICSAWGSRRGRLTSSDVP